MNQPSPYARVIPYAALVAVTMLYLLPVLANPGYYSHDEWQKFDEISLYGLRDFLVRWGSLPASSVEFGFPIRPVSFIVQGFVARFIFDVPWLVHMVDVLMHATVVCLLYAVLKRLSGETRWAWVSALVFALSPLAMPSVIWPAALMDRLYVMWGLAGFLAIERYIIGRASAWWLAAAGLAAALAVLSKETAMVLPGALLGWTILRPQLLRDRRFWLSLATWTLPAALFMAYRLPALLASLQHAATSAYSVSASNLPDGLLLYYAFPFLRKLTEAVNWPIVPGTTRVLAALLHAAIVAALWWGRGWRAALAYLFFYLLFLLPVLTIAWRGAHYLYGPGLAFACGLAALLVQFRGVGQALRWSVAAAASILALWHSVLILQFGMEVGECTNRATLTTQSAHLAAGRPKALHFVADQGAPVHMLHRLFTNRTQLGMERPVEYFIQTPAPAGAAELLFHMNCLVTLLPATGTPRPGQ